MYYGKAQIYGEQFKALVNDAIIDAQQKQESIAFNGGVNQSTVSQWLDPISDRHMPAFQLFLQNEAIVLPVIRKAADRFNLSLTPKTAASSNGSIVDEVLDLGRVEAAFADLINQNDKKKFAVQLDRLKSIVARLEAEGAMMAS